MHLLPGMMLYVIINLLLVFDNERGFSEVDYNFASMWNCQGHAYNTFPKMGDTWIPEDVLDMKPLIRNFFENTSTVQVRSLTKYGIFS